MQTHPAAFRDRKDACVKGSWILPLCLQRPTEIGQQVAWESLHEGPERAGGRERPMQEAVKVKPGLQWRHQDVGDGRAVKHLAKKAAFREFKQFMRKVFVRRNKDRAI